VRPAHWSGSETRPGCKAKRAVLPFIRCFVFGLFLNSTFYRDCGDEPYSPRSSGWPVCPISLLSEWESYSLTSLGRVVRGNSLIWSCLYRLSFLTNRKRETCEFDSRSIHVQQSLSILVLLMAVPLNYEMLESRCINNVPKSSIEPRNGKPCFKLSQYGSNWLLNWRNDLCRRFSFWSRCLALEGWTGSYLFELKNIL
jgi:hypothetical protein